MLPRFSRLRKRPTVASGRKVGRLESSVMPTSRIDITCMGMSNDVETAGSVCEMAIVSPFARLRPRFYRRRHHCDAIARAACWSIIQEPEEPQVPSRGCQTLRTNRLEFKEEVVPNRSISVVGQGELERGRIERVHGNDAVIQREANFRKWGTTRLRL